jgi:hypothetical protein
LVPVLQELVLSSVVGKIKLGLKFNCSYGEKVFEKEYSI